MELPKRKYMRLKNYDYNLPGAYFITICTEHKKPMLWNNVGADIIRPQNIPLSQIGKIVENGILQISQHYNNITVDKYCIMPDHVHLIISINTNTDGRQIAAPTISNVVGQMKRWVSLQIGQSIWQKSFIDRIIRNEKGYKAVWEYIENNPIKMDCLYDNIDFINF